MDVFVFAQTLYYFVASFAIIVLGTLFIIIVYHTVRIAKHLRHISENLDDTSSDIKERIEEVIERLSSLPLFSYLLKKDGVRESNKSHKKRS